MKSKLTYILRRLISWLQINFATISYNFWKKVSLRSFMVVNGDQFILLTLAYKALTHTVLQSNSWSFFKWYKINISRVMKSNAVFRLKNRQSVLFNGICVGIAAKIGQFLSIYDVLKCIDLELETKHQNINWASAFNFHQDLFIHRWPQLVSKPEESRQIAVVSVFQIRPQFDDELWKQ